MADSPADDPSGAGGDAPDPGTSAAPDAAAAAQGAEGAVGAASAEAGTTDAGEALQISRPADPKGEGAEEEGELTKLRDKVGHLQPAHDALATMKNRVKELHPDYFDAEDNFVGAQEDQPAGDEGVLAISRPAGPTAATAAPARAAPARPADPRQPLGVDPHEAWRKDVNTRSLARVFGEVEGEEPDFIGPVVELIDARLAQQGITPDALAKAGGGLTEERVAELVQQGSRAAVQQYDAEVSSFEARTAVIGSEFGEEFLAQTVKFPDRPEMTVKEALPIICAQAGVADPVAAVLVHPDTGRSARAALVNAEAVALANQIVAEGSGEQLVPAGGTFPGGGVATGEDGIKAIGGDTKPLKR